MVKKIVVVVMLCGFAWSVPSVRARVSSVLEPGLVMLGPVGQRLARPAQRWRAESDVSFIVNQLQIERTEGRQTPTNARSFEAWMRQKRGAGNSGRDPWGGMYWMTHVGGVLTVGSDGPDGTRETQDDVTRSIPF